MLRSKLMRGVFAGAFPLVSFTASALAQETLPAIDIAGEQNGSPLRRKLGQLSSLDDGKQTGYARTNAFTATKTNAPLIDTPRAVVVIPRQVLEDNQILNTQEAVKFVSGVQTGLFTYYDAFLIRGFSNGNNTYRDGLKLTGVANASDTAFIERVEILKGPAAMLYGRIQPGGMVNFVTKRPQEEAAYNMQEQFGSWGLSRTTVDATGPLDKEKTLLYRVIGVYDRADDFIDFRHRDNGSVLARLAWRPTEQFEANLSFQYDHLKTASRGSYGQMVPALAQSYAIPGFVGRPAGLPRNWTQMDPKWYDEFPDVMERILVAADWTYRFDNQWSVTNRFHYNHADEMQYYILSRGYNLTTGQMNRKLSWSRGYRDMYSLNIDVNGEVETGPLKHKLLFGFDYFWYHQVYKGDNPPGTPPAGFPMQPIPALDVWAPNYSGIDYYSLHGFIGQGSGNLLSRSNQVNFGYYVQDDISYEDFIHFLIGGRYDVAFDVNQEISGVTQTAAGAQCYPFCDGHYNPSWKGNRTERKISPNGGLLVKLDENFSIYASYAESFGNSNAAAQSADATPLKSQEGQQFEVGAKASLFDGRLTGSIAAFDLYLSNILTPDPRFPNSSFQIAAGKVRNRGLELDVAGQVTDNISIIGSYTNSDAIVLKSNVIGTGAILGKRWPGVPRHAGNLWVKYDTAPGANDGFTFGAGFYANGERQGNTTNSWQLPAYVRFDTMVGYRFVLQNVPIEAQLNVVNIADTKYSESSDGGLNAAYGAPRTFVGSLKVKF
ncbi:MAG TPA: TonB-dependent siderophore receptor [Methylosinus sp.]|jgi:iron complex outermembrane receptor protein|uniref:TonB-dependent siderophore receptor n=1 Tax=Methylosinus sp. TaxID=427 RepID=UPI002F91FDD4